MARPIPKTAGPKTVGGILSYFVRHRTVANLLLLIMLVAGAAAIPNMRAQFFPDVILDNVRVTTTWQGAGAEDVDAGIVQVLEPGLLAVEGVESSDSTSREGVGVITLEFAPGWDMSRAADDVQAAVDTVTTLPEEAEDPKVKRGAWRDRVTDVVITGPVAPEQLGLFADEFVTRLFAAGVTRTTIRGIAAPQVMVEVPTAQLIARDVTMAQIAQAIAAEVNADPAGDVTGANARVRTGVQKRTADEIAGIVLRSDPDGSKLVIGDVARVTREGADRNRTYFVRENTAVSIRVDRSNTGDAIEMQAQVQEVAEAMQLTLPRDVTVELIRTRAESISSRLNLLVDNAIVGLGLVVALLFLFLNARTAFWVAAGIPVAFMAAIAFMWLGGLTLNMISLFGLIITLGIVVDDAIVVGEHADHRARAYGETSVEAAECAAQRMAMPVFAATLTTVIAFFGLIAVGGRFGDLIRDIPFTVIAVLIASLIECFLILPNHMSHALAKRGAAQKFSRFKLLVGLVAALVALAGVSAALFFGGFTLYAHFTEATAPEGGLWGLLQSSMAQTYYVIVGVVVVFLILERQRKISVVTALGTHGIDMPSVVVNHGFDWFRRWVFRPFMGLVIRARYVVLAGVCVVLAGQVVLFIGGDVKWRFFNAPERGSVTGNFAMAEGATRADTLEMMREFQRATEALGEDYEERHGRNPLDYVMAEIGGNAGRGLSGVETKDADLLGGISIELIDADLRPYSSFAFVAELQDMVVRLPLVETVSFRSWRSGPGGDSLSVQFFGADTDVLKSASQDMQKALAEYPEVSAMQDNLAYDKEELILDLTPQGQSLGFTIDVLGRALRDRLNGIEAATFPEGPRSATIRVEVPSEELTADFMERMQMRTPSGAYVPLADIVSVERRTGFSTVRRENGVRLISVTGDISEDDPARAAEVARALEEEILPKIASERQVEWRMSGLSEQESTFLSDALTGLILCLTGIYLVLSWVFGSWTRPMVVMAIIPFGLVGTIYGHHIWDVPLSMFTVVGLLGMTGIIINDSIVLITSIDEYAQDRGLVPSIIDGAADRLRPVLLTTLTTVLGMAPLLYEQSQQAQFLKPTVITLVYGLGFGMVLVLLVVPALVAAQHDVARLVAAMRRGVRARAIGLAWMLRLMWIAVALWGAATMGHVMVTGILPVQMTDAFPGLADMSPMPVAFGLFVLGVAQLVWMAYFLFAAIYQLMAFQRRTSPRAKHVTPSA